MRAEVVQAEDGIPLKYYHIAGRSMHNMVEQFIQNGQLDKAFVLAMKFAILYLEKLPKHIEYKNMLESERKEWKDRCNLMLKRAANLKTELLGIYEQESAEHEKKQKEINILSNSTINQPHNPRESMMLPPVTTFNDNLPSFPVLDLSTLPINRNDECIDVDLPPVPAFPKVDRSLKPVYSKHSSERNEYDWATVHLPISLPTEFLRLAEANTRRNLETCGNLCGRLIDNEFRITDLVILKQKGTPDSCTTTNEEELFDYMDQACLIPIGWIHTHPTQTAFLSSVDQHMQLSYQLMLPEAVAVVCSPKYNETGCFSLTPDQGIPYLQSCAKVGFHPHSTDIQIFRESPHVRMNDSLKFTVTDLR
ncbi:unnamed protein product [Protopolystoma xenopodis]|uniref:MPN domain-containing protein n=1 Tax=Protopolystoma xenopodis TaxID=117903 RepID=A0A3S5AAJ3_9PLAT|nr:unnamed protein product [Protopolystoma xenopodis]